MAVSQSIFGNVAIGKDTSGAFKQSILGGLAVQLKPDGPFYGRIQDGVDGIAPIPDEAIIAGTENWVFRIPVQAKPEKPEAGVHIGDIVVLSDDPLNVVFVDGVDPEKGTINGTLLTPDSVNLPPLKNRHPAANLLNQKFWVVAAGIDRLLGEKSGTDLLPLLLMGTSQGSTLAAAPSGNDALTTLLLLKSLGKEEDSIGGIGLMLLLQNGGAGGSGSLLPLLLAARGGKF